jgi:tetratricopeptide (TPR) repeat protein
MMIVNVDHSNMDINSWRIGDEEGELTSVNAVVHSSQQLARPNVAPSPSQRRRKQKAIELLPTLEEGPCSDTEEEGGEECFLADHTCSLKAYMVNDGLWFCEKASGVVAKADVSHASSASASGPYVFTHQEDSYSTFSSLSSSSLPAVCDQHSLSPKWGSCSTVSTMSSHKTPSASCDENIFSSDSGIDDCKNSHDGKNAMDSPIPPKDTQPPAFLVSAVSVVPVMDGIPKQQQQKQQKEKHARRPSTSTTVAGAQAKRNREDRTSSFKMKQLSEQASGLAARGEEEEAIKLYKKAVRMGMADMKKIPVQLKQAVVTHHVAAIESISERLHEDWIAVGLQTAEIATSLAFLQERLANYAAAIDCASEAVDVCRKQLVFMEKRYPSGAKEILRMIEHLLSLIAQYELAQVKANELTTLTEEIHGLRLKTAMPTTSIQKKKELYKKATDKALAAKKLQVKVCGGETNPLVADMDTLLGTIALEQEDQATAIKYMAGAIAVTAMSLGMKHPRTGTRMLQLARAYSSPKFPKKSAHEQTAIEYYNMAIDVARSSRCSADLVASALNSVASIYMDRKDYNMCIRLLTGCLEEYSNTGESGDVNGFCWDTIQVWKNLGVCYMECKQFGNARTAYANALHIQRRGKKIYNSRLNAIPATKRGSAQSVYFGEDDEYDIPPLFLVDDPSITDTLRCLGKAFVADGCREQGRLFISEANVIDNLYNKSLKKRKKWRPSIRKKRSDDEKSVEGQAQEQLAQTLYEVAELHDSRGDFYQALRLYHESMQLRLFGAGGGPFSAKENSSSTASGDGNQAGRGWEVHSAMCLVGMGGVHMKQNEYVDAHKVFRKAFNFCKAHEIPEDHVIVNLIQTRLSQIQQRVSSKTAVEL